MTTAALRPTLLLAGLLTASTCPAQAGDWMQVQPQNAPTARWAHGMAYDFVRGRTVVFGGREIGGAYLADTWEYDGQDWTQIQHNNVPPARQHCAAAFHVAKNHVVMFGGRDQNRGLLGDTWTWDGKEWTKQSPKNSPPARRDVCLAYDWKRQRTVLFGGLGASSLNDTWEWDGQDWKQIQTANAPSPRSAPIAYDQDRGRIVLFGGSSSSNDTWEYDGVNWTQVQTPNSPPARNMHQLAYDGGRKRTVLFGGSNGNQFQDTWEYDGKSWVQVPTSMAPEARRMLNDGMVYDARRTRLVLFGGIANSGYQNDTWEYVTKQTLTGMPSTISVATGGAHQFQLDAGGANAGRYYWIYGSITGTTPGVTLGSVHIPLNPDVWTTLSIAAANTGLFPSSAGLLDASGQASASLQMPATNDINFIGLKFHHAYIVFDAQAMLHMASNAVELELTK